jgi:plasmid stabilization system protein ParE
VGYQVTFAAQADRDLGSVVRFLAQKNPVAAERLGYALVDHAHSLANLPYRGFAVRKRPGYRRICRVGGSHLTVLPFKGSCLLYRIQHA